MIEFHQYFLQEYNGTFQSFNNYLRGIQTLASTLKYSTNMISEAISTLHNKTSSELITALADKSISTACQLNDGVYSLISYIGQKVLLVNPSIEATAILGGYVICKNALKSSKYKKLLIGAILSSWGTLNLINKQEQTVIDTASWALPLMYETVSSIGKKYLVHQ